jgi:hypothetical protein
MHGVLLHSVHHWPSVRKGTVLPLRLSYRMCTRLFFLGGSTTMPTLSLRLSSDT